MLGSTNAAATIAVKDIAVARRFYEDKLGLQLSATEGETVCAYRSGTSTILVYQSRFAGTNQATAALTFRQTSFESVEERDGHRDGWSECFDRLEDHLAAVPR